MSDDLGTLIRESVERHTAEVTAPSPGLARTVTVKARRRRVAQGGLAAAAVVALVVAATLVIPQLRPPVTGVPVGGPSPTVSASTASTRQPPSKPAQSTIAPAENDADPWSIVPRVVDFALDPSRANFAALQLLPSLEFGVDGRRIDHRPADALTDPTAWKVGDRKTLSGAFAGPFNALTAIQRIRRAGGELTAGHGDLVRCGTTTHIPHAPTLGGADRVTLQPGPDAISSCVDWFAVDLYVDDHGRLVGVYYVAGTA